MFASTFTSWGTTAIPIAIIVEVELENERADLYYPAQKRFKAAPEVQQCYDVTGEPDVVLVILVRSMSD
jgi:DNA-binding Lrp family transcriptional regulator